jgi:putative zinc finger/helix-turn-helix YgiT family protein
MTPEEAGTTEGLHSGGRAFPWRCPACGKKEVRRASVPYSAQIKHDGQLHTVAMQGLCVPKCGACGELVFDNDADEQIARALRSQLGLLSGEQIRGSREALGLSQREMAEQLGVAVETVSRWESGAWTQTRAMDRYLRVFFSVPAARAALVERFGDSPLGVHVER